MSVEIERKFLVNHNKLPGLGVGTLFRQGYLAADPEVRVRISEAESTLTIKSGEGMQRLEFDYQIPANDAVALLRMSVFPIIEKKRYKVEFCGHTWEVDEFLGLHTGLWIAEVELSRSTEHVRIPDWIEDEVTNDRRFSNVHIASRRHLPDV